MKEMHFANLPVPETELRAALGRYKAALEAHKTTLGLPAPWPEHDVLRDVMAAGGDFTVIGVPSARELALQAAMRKRAEGEDAARIALENKLLAEEAKKPGAPQALKDYALGAGLVTPAGLAPAAVAGADPIA